MRKIYASVGCGGTNCPSDIKTIQQLLNRQPMFENVMPLNVNGIIGPTTIERIKKFQKIIVKMSRPDGRVDPNGKTISGLKQSTFSDKSVGSYQMSSKGMDLLKSIEELRLKPYDDQTGKEISSWVKGATIGYGHLIGRDEWNKYKDGMTVDQAKELFKQDLSPFVNAVRSRIKTKISQNQFDALVILTFNIGPKGFATSSVLKLVNDPSVKTAYPNLESAWKAWNKSQGKVMQGLVNRRKSEWNIFCKNFYKKW